MKYFRKGMVVGILPLLGSILIGCAQIGEETPDIIHVESVRLYAEVEAADETVRVEAEDGRDGESGGAESLVEAMGTIEDAEPAGDKNAESTEEAVVEDEPAENADGQDASEITQGTENDLTGENVKETYEIISTDTTYFDDALFIGDSRTVGLREYGTFENADYFASPGLSIYTIPKTNLSIHGSEEMSLEELLAEKDYGKIYLMLGMNELGYKFDQTVERYRTFVEDLQTKEPEAIIYLCANMHVTITRSENDEIYNNPSINMMNAEIAKLANEKELPYLDINALFDDENGNLDVEYASDDSHVLGKYYETWCEWLKENTLIVTNVEE